MKATNDQKTIHQLDIGKIYKIKANSPLWPVELQDLISFVDDKYVKIEHICYNNKYFFGKIFEANLFGAIEKSEVRISNSNIDFSEVYDDIKTFNNAKTFNNVNAF